MKAVKSCEDITLGLNASIQSIFLWYQSKGDKKVYFTKGDAALSKGSESSKFLVVSKNLVRLRFSGVVSPALS